jgi:hypothetical protein
LRAQLLWAACMEFGTIEELAPKLADKPKQVLWAIDAE